MAPVYDLEERNYANDRRVLGGERASRLRFDATRMLLTFSVPALDEELDNGSDDDVDVQLPARFAVCPTCEGRGKHVNPSIDASGITDWSDWSDEERASYHSGAYDVPCYECKGLRVVPEIDEKAADPATLARAQKSIESAYQDELEARSERLMGY